MSQENSLDATIEVEAKTDFVVSEDILESLKLQSRYLNKIMQRLGIVPDHEASSSKDEPENDRQLVASYRRQLDELEEYVTLLRRGLNRWCLSVLVWEFALLALIVMTVAAAGFVFGFVPDDASVQFWLQEAMNRPILAAMSVVVLAIIWTSIHISLRHRQAQLVVRYLQTQVGNGRLSAAFLKNTTFWHSIFRPEPIGWSWANRRRIHKFQEMLVQVEP